MSTGYWDTLRWVLAWPSPATTPRPCYDRDVTRRGLAAVARRDDAGQVPRRKLAHGVKERVMQAQATERDLSATADPRVIVVQVPGRTTSVEAQCGECDD